MKTNTSWRSLTVPFIVLVIIAAALTLDCWAYFQAQKNIPQPQVISRQEPKVTGPLADWKTYQNEIYTFKYPPKDWEVTSVNLGASIYYTKECTKIACHMTGIDVLPTTTTMQNFIKNYDNSQLSQIDKQEAFSINNISGTKLTRSTEIGISENYFFFEKAGKQYILSYKDVDDTVLKQILSTFRFTDDISDWQKYTNDDYGFSLQYPKDWQTKDFSRGMFDDCCGPTSHGKAIDSVKTRSGGHEGIGDPLKIYLQNTTPNQYIAEYNKLYTMGLKNTDWLEKNQKETIDGVEVTHMTIGTAIGSNFELLFFDQGVSKPFFIQYDNSDSIHQQILSTFHFTDDMSDWKTLQAKNYTIQYPATWFANEKIINDTEVLSYASFNNPELIGDFQWLITTYKPTVNLENLITGIGQQFNDRIVSRKNIIINGVPAVKVVVTTTQFDGWMAEMIYLQTDKAIYEISNGAIMDERYEPFYTSFKLIK